MLYPQPAGPNCLKCMNCLRVISQPGPIGGWTLYESHPAEKPQARIRCRFAYWGDRPNGEEKTYTSPWVAGKSDALRRIAERCPDYETDDEIAE